MWNTEYHLRRTKFIVYQLALIFCVISESLGTAALSDYVDQQKYIKGLNNNALEYNNDYIGAASYNIWSGIFTAFIFGGAFFFDLFWPERREIKSVRLAWRICGVLSVIFGLASALTLTIITARHSASVSGVSQAEATRLLSSWPKHSEAPLKYNKNGRAVAAAVFIWPGWCSTFASCVLLFYSLRHDETEGSPLSRHARTRRDIESHPEHELAVNDIDRETKGSDDLDPESDLGHDHEKPEATLEPTQPAAAPYSGPGMSAGHDTTALHSEVDASTAHTTTAPHVEPLQPAPAITHV